MENYISYRDLTVTDILQIEINLMTCFSWKLQGGANVPLPEDPVPRPAAHRGRAARQNARLRRGQASRRHAHRPRHPVRPVQERQQDLATNPVQPVPQDQREAGRRQQHSGALAAADQRVPRARHLHRRRRDPPARRRQDEALDRGRGRLDGRASVALRGHRARPTPPPGDHRRAERHGQGAPHPVLQVNSLQAHAHHFLPRRRQRRSVDQQYKNSDRGFATQ